MRRGKGAHTVFLFVLTVPTIGSLEPFEYGVQVIRQWGIGQKETNNGMLIFVTTDQFERMLYGLQRGKD